MSHKYNENQYNRGFAGYPFTQAVSDSVTTSDSSIVKTVGKGLAESISFSESLVKAVAVLKADTLTSSDAIAKYATTRFSDAVLSSDLKSAEQQRTLHDGLLLGDHLLTIEAEITDTVRLEDWISLHLTKPGVWTEDSTPSSSWNDLPAPSTNPWTKEVPPSDNPWSH